MSGIQLVNPQEFFRDEINLAAANLKIDINDEVEFYLVNLLCAFIFPQSIATDQGSIDINTPLAIMMKNALEAPPGDQIKILKKIGDTSLYFTGYFKDFFRRKTINISYYISMGVSAYNSVSSIMRERHRDDHFTVIYNDLAAEFENLVGLISHVADTDEKIKSNPNNIELSLFLKNNTKDELQ